MLPMLKFFKPRHAELTSSQLQQISGGISATVQTLIQIGIEKVYQTKKQPNKKEGFSSSKTSLPPSPRLPRI